MFSPPFDDEDETLPHATNARLVSRIEIKLRKREPPKNHQKRILFEPEKPEAPELTHVKKPSLSRILQPKTEAPVE